MKTQNLRKLNNKSNVKVIGLKSVFVVDNGLYLTSFGKGSSAVLEKEIKVTKGEFVSANINPKPTYEIIDSIDKLIKIGKNKLRGEFNNFLEMDQSIHDDLVKIKDKVEKLFFTEEKSDDNIHVQIAYQIFDIYKIIFPFVNKILFSLRAQIGGNLYSDHFQGNILKTAYRKNTVLKAVRDEKIFYQTPVYDIVQNGKSSKLKPKNEEVIIKTFNILTKIRNELFHFDQKYPSKLFNENIFGNIETSFISDEFSKIQETVNNSFIKNNVRRFDILRKVFANLDMNKLVQEFYDYQVFQDGKNQGYSIARMKKQVFLAFPELSSDKYKEEFRKMNILIDFIIYNTINLDQELKDKLISSLRNLKSKDESQKDDIYKTFFISFKEHFRKALDILLLNMSDNATKSSSDDFREYKDIVFTKYVNNEPSSFVKIILVLTSFLEQKEINDLTTTIINKLNNIKSFCDIYKDIRKKAINFRDDYKMFRDLDNLIRDIRFIKLSANRKPDIIPTKNLYKAAFQILGDQSDNLTGSDSDFVNNHLSLNSKEKKTRDYRNFIINNIVKSKIFLYTIKLVKPQDAYVVGTNPKIIGFVLENIYKNDSKIIDKYYFKLFSLDPLSKPKDEKILALVNEIKKIKFDQFKDVRTNKDSPRAEKTDSALLVHLYLMIIYQFYKNLFNINARYNIGFWAFERDTKLHFEKDEVEVEEHLLEEYLLEEHLLEEHLLEEHLLLDKFLKDKENNKDNNKKQIAKLKACLNELGDKKNNCKILKTYRDNVAHLTVITDAYKYVSSLRKVENYFEIYHSVMQFLLYDKEKSYDGVSETLRKYLDSAKKYGAYTKNLVHVLNIPLAYNYSRYKKLSTKELFDRNDEKIVSKNC